MLRIKKEHWNDILSGKDKYLFMPLKSAIASGEHIFVSTPAETKKNMVGAYDEYGTANVEPILVNPRMLVQTLCQNKDCTTDNNDYCQCENENFKDVDWAFISQETENEYDMVGEDDFKVFYEGVETSINKETYEFVMKEFVNKNIDFVVYLIKNVEGKDETIQTKEK